jgi:hypothetical protein
MTSIRAILRIYFVLIFCTLAPLMAQSAASTENVVPSVLKFNGVLNDGNGQPLSGTVGVTFLLYKEPTGGAPLWMETQNIQVDKSGRYSVMLGSTTNHGIPAEAFAAGEARWIGIQIGGQTEQARVQLVSVPYALKAADAQTLGGLPASAFLLAAPQPTTVATAAATSQSALASTTAVTTGGGTAQALAKFDGAADIASSEVFDTGTNVGIGTSTPVAKLDVKGATIVRGALTLPTTGNATAAAGKNSQPLNLSASGFNSNIGQALNETFRWQVEPVGNNTANPLGKLSLLFGLGSTTPSETGLSVSNAGIINFASGQTFPGTTNGTVRSVGLSAPASDFSVSGSPVTTSGTLNLQWLVAPGSGDVANAIVKRDATGSFSASTLSLDNNLNVAKFVTASNIFATDSMSANGTIIAGKLIGSTSDTNLNIAAVTGDATAFNTSGITFGVDGSSNSANGVGTHGVGNLNGVWGESFSGVTGSAGVFGVSDGFGNAVSGFIESSAGSAVAAVNAGTGDALFAQNSSGGFAAFFLGNVDVDGTLSKAAGSFKIDHPLDPANKYLYHSFVESPDMMNIYNGTVTTNAQGDAVVNMPDWFEALNRDFRYQLTVIGQFAQAIVASEMSNHTFTIKTDKPNVKVSWQVTGIRHDAFADAHRIPVEQLKPEKERGLYLHPELFGAPEEKSVVEARHPGAAKLARARALHHGQIQ